MAKPRRTRYVRRALETLLNNPLLFLFLSYTFGLVIDQGLRRTIDYSQISHLKLFQSPESYERLGILHFRRLLLRSRLTMNPGLKDGIKSWEPDYLQGIRDHMTGAEIGHWAGAAFLLCVTLVAVFRGISAEVIFGYLVLNLVGNVYLSLLQQYNKTQLDRVLRLANEAKVAREQRTNRRTQHGSLPAGSD